MKSFCILLVLLICSIAKAQVVSANIRSGKFFTGTNAAAGGGSLTDNLVAYWPLSANLNDTSGGGNHLTDHGTIPFSSTCNGNGADFTATVGQYADRADNAALSAANIDLMVWCWVKWGPTSNRRTFVEKGNDTASLVEYMLEYNSSADRYAFFWNNAVVYADTHGSPSVGDDGVCTLIVGWHNASDNTIHIKINNEADNSAAHTGGTDGTGAFNIARRSDDAAYFIDLINRVGVRKQVPSAQDLTDLWNGGAGWAGP